MQTPPRLEAAAELRLVGGLDTFLGKKDSILLSQVRLNGSLQCAASIAGMGYRQAIEHVRAINESAGRPLVASQQGGSRGGCTNLTPLGERILDLYSKASREHQKWIVELNERLRPELAWTLG
jgi:molybdate transport system regulatory protein